MEDVSKLEWTDLVAIGLETRLMKDKAQWVLGVLGSQIVIKYGEKALQKFSQEVHVDHKSMLVYRWVVTRFIARGLQLPQDRVLPFRSYQIAAGTEKPAEWIEKATDNGWTSNQLYFEIKKSRGEVQDHIHDIEILERCSTCGRILSKVKKGHLYREDK